MCGLWTGVMCGGFVHATGRQLQERGRLCRLLSSLNSLTQLKRQLNFQEEERGGRSQHLTNPDFCACIDGAFIETKIPTVNTCQARIMGNVRFLYRNSYSYAANEKFFIAPHKAGAAKSHA